MVIAVTVLLALPSALPAQAFTLTADPRLIVDYAEAIARLPALVRLLEQRESEGETLPQGHIHHAAET